MHGNKKSLAETVDYIPDKYSTVQQHRLRLGECQLMTLLRIQK